MAGRNRALFAALVAACVVAAAAAIAVGISGNEPRARTSVAARRVLPDAQAARRPVVVFRVLKPMGQIAVAPLDPAPRPRTFAPLSCDRVHFAAGRGICLTQTRSLPGTSSAQLFASDFRPRHRIGLVGIPSRARVSPDGRYGAVTTFVSGDSYAAADKFSTRTTLIDLVRGKTITELEHFTVTRAGRKVTAVDANYWGVTFARDSDRFYATLATGGSTFLIAGSVRRRGARAIRENAECPSLSPDGTRVAYKKRVSARSTPWRLAVLDLSTMRERLLAERRSVDDQVEWLDDADVLYGVDGQVWSIPAGGTGRPRRFIAGATSPAVVRW